jgi:ABC-2 type transport system permease protein
LLASTLLFAEVLYWLGSPDTGVVATTYLGLALYGAAALAVGLWASSLTSNQALSAVIGMGVLVLLSVSHLAGSRTTGWLAEVLNEASLVAHFSDLRRGVLDITDVAYYLSVVAVFLFLSVRSLESRRWI